jgi:hypothetical protein
VNRGYPALAMTPLAALTEGIRRVNRAPALIAGVWATTLLVGLPLALTVREAMAGHLAASLEAEGALSGANYDWMQEFAQQASGAAVTFGPRVVGFAAVVDNLSAFLDGRSRPLAILIAGAVMLTLWTFLAGGLIDRYARGRPTRTHGFFAVSGVFFGRFLRLAVVAAAAYGLVLGTLHSWLFEVAYPALTRDSETERVAFSMRVGLYAVFAFVLGAVNVVFDYAKVRAVIEDRRSMLSALVAAVRFIARNRGTVVTVYLLNAGLGVLVLAAYALVAPGVGAGGWSTLIALVIGQLYIVARIWTKLVFWASEAALFQGRLAHSNYVARREPEWPESPAVEAIRGS